MSKIVKEAILRAGVLQKGHFIFAAGSHATHKLEMDMLWDDPEALGVVIQALAEAKGLPQADVILGVPTGGQRLADRIGMITGLPVAQLERVPGGAKQDFRFVSLADRNIGLSATSPRIYEDVVSTLSSVAGVVRLLEPNRQNINALAVWRRGNVQKQYGVGVSDHYLIEEAIESYAPEHCPVCN